MARIPRSCTCSRSAFHAFCRGAFHRQMTCTWSSISPLSSCSACSFLPSQRLFCCHQSCNTSRKSCLSQWQLSSVAAWKMELKPLYKSFSSRLKNEKYNSFTGLDIRRHELFKSKHKPNRSEERRVGK